ncbi:MAG: hypothetical protein IT317_06560 [Anaerolineales bacterium]|nr:hypothetical protein [Anaerolineales bacterium]
MDLITVMGLTAALLFISLVLRRVERRALGVFVIVLVVPLLLLIAGWAQLYHHWSEVGVAAVTTVVLAAALGLFTSRFQRARSDTIQVWGQEKTPRPSPAEAAEMRAELLRLKDEKARLEAEVQRLKDSGED